mmetsp:Transcript_832/g.2039  ORF Transcript_832/g.2039 Transcript_832/m.2039 type:complete len:256 (+) Transcript_832:390-1157(+)
MCPTTPDGTSCDFGPQVQSTQSPPANSGVPKRLVGRMPRQACLRQTTCSRGGFSSTLTATMLPSKVPTEVKELRCGRRIIRPCSARSSAHRGSRQRSRAGVWTTSTRPQAPCSCRRSANPPHQPPRSRRSSEEQERVGKVLPLAPIPWTPRRMPSLPPPPPPWLPPPTRRRTRLRRDPSRQICGSCTRRWRWCQSRKMRKRRPTARSSGCLFEFSRRRDLVGCWFRTFRVRLPRSRRRLARLKIRCTRERQSRRV